MVKKCLLIVCISFLSVTVWSVAQVAPTTQALEGVIDNTTVYQEYPLAVTSDGSTIVVDMRPVESVAGGNLDTLLYLVDPDGNIVAENDDRAKNSDSSSLLIFPQATKGQYRIIATRYNLQDGDTSGRYRLQISTQAAQGVPFDVSSDALVSAGFPMAQTVATTSDWTVLAYYGGDNNLEQAILNDLKEFEKGGGSDKKIHIIALVDRSPQFSTSDGDWQDTRIYEVTASQDHEQTFKLDSTVITEFNQTNQTITQGEFFAQFMVWAIQKYPARNYVVALASHGGGWQGVIQDDSASITTSDDADSVANSLMTVPDIQQAFALANETAGIGKFALLINDACLMSSVEYFSAVAPYFHFAIASPEIVVDPALDMTLFTKMLRQSGQTVDFTTMGRALVNQYIDVDVQQRNTNDIGYLANAVTNLDAFDSVHNAVENFATVVNASVNSRGDVLGKARSNTYTYTHFMGYNEKVDLGSLMRQVIANTEDLTLISAANEVLSALTGAKLYGHGGKRVTDITSYYNIYFPENKADFQTKYFDQSPLSEWGRMLRNYYNVFTPQRWRGDESIVFHEPKAPHINITAQLSQVGSIINPPYFGMEYVGRKITTGFMTIDYVQEDGTAVRYLNEIQQESRQDEAGNSIRVNNWAEGVGLSYIRWDATLPVLTDGTNHANEFITTLDANAYFVQGRYREPNSETWQDVNVAFDAQGNVQSVLNRSQVNDAVAIISIPTGSQFQTYRSTVTADGRVVNTEGNTYIWQTYGLRWSLEPAPKGTYTVGLLLTAFGGSTGFTSTQVEIDNRGVNPNLRGDIVPAAGFLVPRQKDWPVLGLDPSYTSYSSSSPDKTAKIVVYFAQLAEPSPQLSAFGDAIINAFGLEKSGEYVPGNVTGVPVLQFAYRHTDGETTLNGELFVKPLNAQVAIAFAVEVVDGTEAYTVTDLYADLYSGTQLFDGNQFISPPDNEWTSADALTIGTTAINYNIRKNWISTVSSDNWQTSRPDDTANTFFATTLLDVQTAIQTQDGSLSYLVTGRVTNGLEKVVIRASQFYYGRNNLEWSVTLYEATRDGEAVVGRVYVTPFKGQSVVVWMETPQDSQASDTFSNVLEPMMNSYLVEEVP